MTQDGNSPERRPSRYEDTFVDAHPADVVSFNVICAPRAGWDLEELRRRVSLETIEQSTPTGDTLAAVRDQLRTLGFQPVDIPGPVICATGRVALFERVFDTHVVRRVRTFRVSPHGEFRSPHGEGGPAHVETSIVLAPGAPAPSPGALPRALAVVVTDRPIAAVPRLPPTTPQFRLHVPGDIAQLTAASLTHRRLTPSAAPATGRGIRVAVVDTEFEDHPFFKAHGYRIGRLMPGAAPSFGPPPPHGTSTLACMLACAPDVESIGVGIGEDSVLAFLVALDSGARVISFSFVWDLDGEISIPYIHLPLQISILSAVSLGVTVVVSAGNGEVEAFPALMPEVVAVGAVRVDAPSDTTSPWPGSSSFVSRISPGRVVPDLCGMGEAILAPSAAPQYWMALDGTSFATPQVAGVTALLLQKRPQLTPQQVRDALVSGAVPVPPGFPPGPGTGAGLVNALNSWKAV